jgi:hypothetical protein
VALVRIFFATAKRRGAAVYAGIRKDRDHINFTDIKSSMWDWNGETFQDFLVL